MKNLKEKYDSIPEEPNINLISESPIVSGSNNFIIGYWNIKIILKMGSISEDYNDRKVYRNDRGPNKILYMKLNLKLKV